MNVAIHILALIFTAVGLMIYYVVTHGGSEMAKKVVTENKLCQDLLKKQKTQDYEICQDNLNLLVETMIYFKELDTKNCKLNPKDQNTAVCSLKLGLLTKDVVTSAPMVMKKLIKGADQNSKRKRRSYDVVDREGQLDFNLEHATGGGGDEELLETM